MYQFSHASNVEENWFFMTPSIATKFHYNNRRKTKSLYCPQLDHHDADELAGHKTWRTTQTTMRRYKYSLLSIF
jgi:hypothetical protein